MKQVRIEIEDNRLRDLGVEQENTFVPFRFNESAFIGYWFDEASESIHFYVGPQGFMCKNCQKNIDLFESILNESSSRNNNL